MEHVNIPKKNIPSSVPPSFVMCSYVCVHCADYNDVMGQVINP